MQGSVMFRARKKKGAGKLQLSRATHVEGVASYEDRADDCERSEREGRDLRQDGVHGSRGEKAMTKFCTSTRAEWTFVFSCEI